jgi:hypothetical protein
MTDRPTPPPTATTDESIGRPQDWREGRYQKPGQPLEASVNDPTESAGGEPEDTFGTQTPPRPARQPPPIESAPPKVPGRRAVTFEDYTDIPAPPDKG